MPTEYSIAFSLEIHLQGKYVCNQQEKGEAGSRMNDVFCSLIQIIHLLSSWDRQVYSLGEDMSEQS